VKIIPKEVNLAQMTILGLIREKERHPYEINHVIEEREMRNWTDIGKSSIYRILIKLEKEGLVKFKNKIRQSRNLKIYSITKKGEELLKNFVFNSISKGRNYQNFILALSNILVLNKKEQIMAFNNCLKTLKEQKQHLEYRAGLAPNKFFVQSLFILPKMLIDTQIEFTELFLEELKNNEDDNE